MDNIYFQRIVTAIILGVLIILSFFLLKPILLSVIMGFILAFAFTPVYNRLYKITKSKNISSFSVCALLILIIFVPLSLLIPSLVDQSVKLYLAVQQIDLITPLKNFFPSLENFSQELGSVLQSFLSKATNSLINSLSNIILDFPTIFLQFTVVFFTFFFVLKDKEKLIAYVQSLLPFSKEVENKLFKSSRDITSSVIYGQVIVGLIQGIVAGMGFFIFQVPNALLLTLFASLAGVIPIIGTGIIWLPVVLYLFFTGNTFAAVGVLIFGILSSVVDNFIKPFFVSKRTTMHPALIMVGMIGGFMFFGILGFILGPLIIAYLLIVLDIYRNIKIPGILTENTK